MKEQVGDVLKLYSAFVQLNHRIEIVIYHGNFHGKKSI